MKRQTVGGVLVMFSGFVGAGCAAESSAPPGARLDLQVGALSLPGVGRVCYDVSVANGDGDIVWSRGVVGTRANQGDGAAICSDQFGNTEGGDVTYVGPCDASAPQHTVRLWIDSIEDTNGVALSDWRDPCPTGPGGNPGGCVQIATCTPNADTLVAYDLTVMRAANQGFFDVAVNFEDIFCSAKLDCTYDEAGLDPIRLLHHDGERSQTAVIGFACTGGPGGASTVLHATDIRVSCGSASSGQALATVPFGTLADGSAFGFEVQSAFEAPPRLVPVIWRHTAEGTWATGEVLTTGDKNSGQLLWHLGGNRIAGPTSTLTSPVPPPSRSGPRSVEPGTSRPRSPSSTGPSTPFATTPRMTASGSAATSTARPSTRSGRSPARAPACTSCPAWKEPPARCTTSSATSGSPRVMARHLPSTPPPWP